MNLWEEILARVETKVNRHSFYTWFKPTTFVARGCAHDHRSGPEPAVQGLADEALLGRHRRGDERSAEAEPRRQLRRGTRTREARSPRLAARTKSRRGRNGSRAGRRARAGGPQSPLHLRHLHRRLVESVRARGVPRGRRGAVAFLQPAVHLRRRGSRQDASDARGRAVRAAARSQSEAHLHLVRAVHERDDQRGPLRSHHRFPRALPDRRRAARRRHPVSRRQGRHADRVLPHVQRAVRLAEADRASAATVRRTRFRRSRSGCGRDSSGA